MQTNSHAVNINENNVMCWQRERTRIVLNTKITLDEVLLLSIIPNRITTDDGVSVTTPSY